VDRVEGRSWYRQNVKFFIDFNAIEFSLYDSQFSDQKSQISDKHTEET